MGLFGRDTNHEHSHIDPATGRNKRDKSPYRETRGGGPRRQIGTGKIISRAAWRRAQRTGRPEQDGWDW